MGRQGRQSRPVGTLTSRVHIIRAGREYEFEVPSGALSVLDAGLDAGVDLPYSCCAGICTSCCAKLLQGSVSDAAQTVLDEDEQTAGYVLCCQVLPTSSEIRLTFDEPLVRATET